MFPPSRHPAVQPQMPGWPLGAVGGEAGSSGQAQLGQPSTPWTQTQASCCWRLVAGQQSMVGQARLRLRQSRKAAHQTAFWGMQTCWARPHCRPWAAAAAGWAPPPAWWQPHLQPQQAQQQRIGGRERSRLGGRRQGAATTVARTSRNMARRRRTRQRWVGQARATALGQRSWMVMAAQKQQLVCAPAPHLLLCCNAISCYTRPSPGHAGTASEPQVR